jgi:hypothetical protein
VPIQTNSEKAKNQPNLFDPSNSKKKPGKKSLVKQKINGKCYQCDTEDNPSVDNNNRTNLTRELVDTDNAEGPR